MSMYSDDSAEQTWNMISAMMNATNEEEMKEARAVMKLPEGRHSASLPRSSHESKRGARGPRASRESERRAVSRPSRRASREIIPAEQGPGGAVPGLPSISLQVSRQQSSGSIFSVVIKPFRSTDGPRPLVEEDAFPPRVKRIIEDARERACFEEGLNSLDEDEDDVAYHSDVAAALETLHRCESSRGADEYDWDSEY